MAVLNQLCVAESSTKAWALLPSFAMASVGMPVRRLDLAQNLSFSPAQYFFNGLLYVGTSNIGENR